MSISFFGIFTVIIFIIGLMLKNQKLYHLYRLFGYGLLWGGILVGWILMEMK